MDEKLNRIIKFLLIILMIFGVVFSLLLLLDWLFPDFVDYIPGVGEGSGAGFILESLIRFLLG